MTSTSSLLGGFARLCKRQAESIGKWALDSKSVCLFGETRLKKIQVVMGNEASDLDSMVCSFAYAYYKSVTEPESSIAYLPVMNIPREDFQLRGEAPFVFQKANILPEDLLFLEDVNLKQLSKVCDHKKATASSDQHPTTMQLRVTLVDHNRLASTQTFLSHCVSEIVDHHVDEGMFVDQCRDRRLIETMGSCSTLVEELILESSDLLSGPNADADLGFLLLSAVVLDTGCMNPQLKKGTPRDGKCMEYLAGVCNLSGADLAPLHDKLLHLRQDVSQYSSQQLFVKDSKGGQANDRKYVISTVPISLEDWVQKDASLAKNIAEFAESNNLDFFAIMTTFTDDNGLFQRQLLMYCPETKTDLFDHLVSEFESSDLGLQRLVDTGLGPRPNLVAFSQSNVGSSRKAVLPIAVQSLSRL